MLGCNRYQNALESNEQGCQNLVFSDSHTQQQLADAGLTQGQADQAHLPGKLSAVLDRAQRRLAACQRRSGAPSCCCSHTLVWTAGPWADSGQAGMQPRDTGMTQAEARHSLHPRAGSRSEGRSRGWHCCPGWVQLRLIHGGGWVPEALASCSGSGLVFLGACLACPAARNRNEWLLLGVVGAKPERSPVCVCVCARPNVPYSGQGISTWTPSTHRVC